MKTTYNTVQFERTSLRSLTQLHASHERRLFEQKENARNISTHLYFVLQWRNIGRSDAVEASATNTAINVLTAHEHSPDMIKQNYRPHCNGSVTCLYGCLGWQQQIAQTRLCDVIEALLGGGSGVAYASLLYS